MVSVNHIISSDEDRKLKMHRKNELKGLQIVMKHLQNIDGIGLVHSSHNAELKDGLIIVVELNRHRLSETEIEVISKLGLQLPLLSRSGEEIEVERINLDSDDIKILSSI